ncbi:MAG TPA: retropepsin-like aspartic protease, partial [Stellaceae bacterium]
MTGLFGLFALLQGVMAPAGSSAAEEIFLTTDRGTYTVPVRLNNAITLPFTIDTGAASVVIPADVASTLLRTGTLSQRDFIGRTTAVIADGSTLPSFRVVLHEVRVGNQSVQNVLASILPAKGDPLLGQSFKIAALDARLSAECAHRERGATASIRGHTHSSYTHAGGSGG